jgi:hypothetical protein
VDRYEQIRCGPAWCAPSRPVRGRLRSSQARLM